MAEFGKIQFQKKNNPTAEQKGTVEWRSPSNIALIKYWGKHKGQIPMNPSLSMTLKYAFTQTEVSWEPKNTNEKVAFDFFLGHEKAGEEFEKRIEMLIRHFANEFPQLLDYRFNIKSINTFPHSTGIASSASGLSALALSILSVALKTNAASMNYDEQVQKASYYARLGSGSACRSVEGPYMIWGSGAQTNSSDQYAIPFTPHKDFHKIHDSIILFDKRPKKVGSSAGHALMKEHPYRKGRIEQAKKNTKKLIEAMNAGDFETWQYITEQEALSLHGLMMSSPQPVLLLEPNTLKFINDLLEFRTGKGYKVAFTIDAGPNIHLLYAPSDRKAIQDFIGSWLLDNHLNLEVIDDETGNGAKQLF